MTQATFLKTIISMGLQPGETGKVNKYGMRQKAKKNIAKRALAEKATQQAGEAANNFREDVEDREEEESATRFGVWAESSHEDTKANED